MIAMTWTGWDGSVWNLRTGPVRLTADGMEGLSNLDFEVFTQDTALRDGQIMTGWKAKPRDVVMPVLIGQSETDTDWLATERAWMKTMHPAKPGKLTVEAPDGSARGLTLRFVNDGMKVFDRDPSKQRVSVYPLRMIADDPWFIGPSFGRQFVSPKQIIDFYGGGPTAARYGWTGTRFNSASTKTDPDGTVTTNYVTNPGAEGDTAALLGSYRATASMVANTTMGQGARSYKVEQNYADAPSAYYANLGAASRPVAGANETWHARATVRPTETSYGARKLSLQLRAIASNGAIIGTENAYQTTVDLIPTGVFTRWTGTANVSTSERYEGTVKRKNLVQDPDTTGTTRWAAGSADMTTVAGKLRATPTATATAYVYPTVDSSVSNGGGRYLAAPGARITMRAQAFNAGTATTWVRAGIAYYTASGAGSTTTQTTLGPFIQLAPGEGARVELAATMQTADSNTTGFLPLLYVYPTGTGGIATSANAIDTANWTVETGPNAPTASPFDHFSGATANTGTGIADAVDLIVSMTTPDGTASLSPHLLMNPTYRDSATDAYYVDNLLVAKAPALPDYFDGDTVGKLGATPFYISPSNRLDTATITNPGDIPVWPVYTFEGPIDSFKTTVGTGVIAGTFPIRAGEKLTIETSPLRQIALLWNAKGVATNVTRKLSSFGFRPIPPGEQIKLDTSVVGTGTFYVDGSPHYFRGW